MSQKERFMGQQHTHQVEWQESNMSLTTTKASEPDHLNLIQQHLGLPPMLGRVTESYK